MRYLGDRWIWASAVVGIMYIAAIPIVSWPLKRYGNPKNIRQRLIAVVAALVLIGYVGAGFSFALWYLGPHIHGGLTLFAFASLVAGIMSAWVRLQFKR